MKTKSKVSPLEKHITHHNLMSSVGFYLRSSMREARRRKLYFCLAICSTFIVVAATAVSQTVIEYAPLIFLNTAESSAGAQDVALDVYDAGFYENDGLTVQYVHKRLLFNTTQIQSEIEPMYPGSTIARYVFPSSSVTRTQTTACTVSQPCYTVEFHLQDTAKEAEHGMVPDSPMPETIPYGGVILCAKFARSISVKKGGVVYMNLDVSELLRDLVVQYNTKQSSVSTMLAQSSFAGAKTSIPFRIYSVVDDLNGKYPDGTTDVIITEYQYFFEILSKNMPNLWVRSNPNYPRFIDFMLSENARDYASRMIFNMKDRRTIYRESNYDLIQDQVTLFGSKISDALGVFPYDISLPVLEELTSFKFAGLFLGIVMVIMIVILFILSTILIYNLLLVTVETKTFEFGVIRMIGLTKMGIGQLILVQALLFALPGVALGIGLSVPLLNAIGGYLQDSLSTSIPNFPSGTALFWSIFIGVAIPVISSYYPMKSALSKNLNLSLDLVHSKTNAIQVSIEVGHKVFPWTQITFGILAVLFGVGIYIVLPLSLLSMQLGLLLGMFFLILIGLLIGLTILSLNFQHLMARLVTAVFFFWTTSSFRLLILKNLIAHKLRNRQTAMMYSLALGFILFLLVSLNQELNSMAYQAQATHGALLELKSDGNLDVEMLENLIETKLSDSVEHYAFVSHDLVTHVTQAGIAQGVVLTHKGQLYTFTPTIRAVSPTIYKTTINQFLVVDQGDENTGLDLGEQLYTPRGSQGCIIGHAYKEQLGITDELDSSLLLKLENGINSKTEELRVIAALDSSPVFKFSQIPSVTKQDVIISFPTYARIASNLTLDVRDIPVEKLLIKVKGDSPENVEKVFTELNKLKQSNGDLKIWDYRDTEDTIQGNQEILSFLFKGIEVLVMLLSMFSLVTSMSTNILEQTKEIAVLRAIGMTKLKINFLYVSEAFVLIFSSALFGVFIGTVVAWTLSIQRVLFTQLPLIFTFPWGDLILISIVAAISAFVSSFFPARRVTKYQISKVIRIGS